MRKAFGIRLLIDVVIRLLNDVAIRLLIDMVIRLLIDVAIRLLNDIAHRTSFDFVKAFVRFIESFRWVSPKLSLGSFKAFVEVHQSFGMI